MKLKEGTPLMDAWKDSIGGDIAEVLFDEESIQRKVAEIGAEIRRDYAGRRVLLVGVLNGCFPFIADLARAVHGHVEVDFMSVSSYAGGTQSSGVVRILKDLNQSIEGRDVLLVEDIIDTGLTARYLLDNLRTRHPATLEVCSLLDKREARMEEVPIRYVGFACPTEFVVGYGLDYRGLYRNLPFIGVLREEAIGR
jgi:hypoxanthine phosphoribosyltransferase